MNELAKDFAFSKDEFGNIMDSAIKKMLWLCNLPCIKKLSKLLPKICLCSIDGIPRENPFNTFGIIPNSEKVVEKLVYISPSFRKSQGCSSKISNNILLKL